MYHCINWGDPKSTLKVGATVIAISTVRNDVKVPESTCKYPAYSSKEPPCCKHVYVLHVPSIDEAVGCHDER